MALTPDALEYRETPTVNPSFVALELPPPIGPPEPLLPFFSGPPEEPNMLNGEGSVGEGNGHVYPPMPIGILISAIFSDVLIFTDNGPFPMSSGINIPMGQSLYLPIAGPSVAELLYWCSDPCTVGVFFAE